MSHRATDVEFTGLPIRLEHPTSNNEPPMSLVHICVILLLLLKPRQLQGRCCVEQNVGTEDGGSHRGLGKTE